VSGLPDAPATARNREPILAVIRDELASCRQVLEIGSGTGQHAVYFAANLPDIVWQTSDRRENHADITAWLTAAGSANLRPPLALDVLSDADPAGPFDGVFSANTAHIMSIDAVVAMFALVGRLLPAGQPFCLYGPFRIDGEFTSDSNADFDASLRRRDPVMGIRDLEYLDELAGAAGLRRSGLVAMPANNFIAVWRKLATAAG
jgi:Protein of unknown function (DUF938)